MTAVDVTAVDKQLTINSLLTATVSLIQVFIGLYTHPSKPHIENASCIPSPDTRRNLFAYQIVSLLFCMCSSLVIYRLRDKTGPTRTDIDTPVPKRGLVISALMTLASLMFMALAFAGVVELNLGKLSCGGGDIVVALVSLVGYIALLHISMNIRTLVKLSTREASKSSTVSVPLLEPGRCPV